VKDTHHPLDRQRRSPGSLGCGQGRQVHGMLRRRTISLENRESRTGSVPFGRPSQRLVLGAGSGGRGTCNVGGRGVDDRAEPPAGPRSVHVPGPPSCPVESTANQSRIARGIGAPRVAAALIPGEARCQVTFSRGERRRRRGSRTMPRRPVMISTHNNDAPTPISNNDALTSISFWHRFPFRRFPSSRRGLCHAPPIGCKLSTNRKRKRKWRRCVAASTAVGPSAILTGSRTRPSDWGWNRRFGPVEDRTTVGWPLLPVLSGLPKFGGCTFRTSRGHELRGGLSRKDSGRETNSTILLAVTIPGCWSLMVPSWPWRRSWRKRGFLPGPPGVECR